MSLLIVDPEGLEEEIMEFDKSRMKIKEIFQKEKYNVNILNNGHSWVGDAAEAMYNKQKEFQENFEPIEEALEVFSNYLKDSLENYRAFERAQKKYVAMNKEALEVNS